MHTHTHPHTPLYSGCESLLDDFDPLRSGTITSKAASQQEEGAKELASKTTTDSKKQDRINADRISADSTSEQLQVSKIVELSVTEPSPESSPIPIPRRSSNPFRVSGDFSNVNPFSDSFSSSSPFSSTVMTDSLTQPNGMVPHDIRHCTSETNLSKLKKEYQPLRTLGEVEPLVTRSEEDLLSSTAESRHCMVDVDSHRHINGGLGSPKRRSGSRETINDPLDYKSRRSRSNENSPTQLRKLMNQGSVDCKLLIKSIINEDILLYILLYIVFLLSYLH